MPSTQAPKGTRDLLPAAARRRQRIVSAVREAFEAHGFEPLETPALENLSTLLGKYGDEGDQLIFRIMKRGASLSRALASEQGATEGTLGDMGLRYDLTVPLARVVAHHQNDLPTIFKRYQIQPVWRADRPAKGRFREFSQCDVDIVGAASMVADAEVLGAAATALRSLGFEDIAFLTNHRDVLFGLIEAAGIDPAMESSALVAVDKLDKIGWEGVEEELSGRGLSAAQIERLRSLLDAEDTDNGATLDRLQEALSGSTRGARGTGELRELLQLTAHGPAAGFIRITPSLARGLSYYTGPIFEVKSPQLAGSIAAGGRYDGLVGMFLGRDLPAVGFSLGLERLEVVMETLGLSPPGEDTAPNLMIAHFGDDLGALMALAAELRAEGLRVDLFPEPARLGKQFKAAELRGIRHVALLGSSELAEGVVSIKDLHTGDQMRVPRDKLAAALLTQA